jgi:predicted glutamine amidotransferase
MCELFCLSSRLPTVATISLHRFAEHGGPGGRSIDGWGLALFDGGDLRLYREPSPARDDPWLEFIRTRRIPSRLLISHIRHATQGAVTLANTQPFVREIAGRMHCFAHNGRLPCIEKLHSPAPTHYRPVGDTDSEYAACLLFESMATGARRRTAASPRPACGGCSEAALLILTPSLGPACISRRPLGRRGLHWWQACR